MTFLDLPPQYEWRADLSQREGERVVRALYRDQDVVVRLQSAGRSFAGELELLARLDHPRLGRLVHYETTPDGIGVLVRAWVPGQEWQLNPEDDGATREGHLRHWIALCDALQHLHDAGFAHGDLKPSNVLIDTQDRLVLTDFGLAQTIQSRPEADPSGSHAGLAGSAGYLAPECLQGAPRSPAGDRFALGVLLFQVLGGTLPEASTLYGRFPADSFWSAVRQQPEDFPAWSRSVLTALLARDPDRRPSSAREAAFRVATACGLRPSSEPIPAPRWPVLVGVPSDWEQRGPGLETPRTASAPGNAWRLPWKGAARPIAEAWARRLWSQGLPFAWWDLSTEIEVEWTAMEIDQWAQARAAQAERVPSLFVADLDQPQERRALEVVGRAIASLARTRLQTPSETASALVEGAWVGTPEWNLQAWPVPSVDAVTDQLARWCPSQDVRTLRPHAQRLLELTGGHPERMQAQIERLHAGGWLPLAPDGWTLRVEPWPSAWDGEADQAVHAAVEAWPQETRALLAALLRLPGATSQWVLMRGFGWDQETWTRASAPLRLAGWMRASDTNGAAGIQVQPDGPRWRFSGPALDGHHVDAWWSAALQASPQRMAWIEAFEEEQGRAPWSLRWRLQAPQEAWPAIQAEIETLHRQQQNEVLAARLRAFTATLDQLQSPWPARLRVEWGACLLAEGQTEAAQAQISALEAAGESALAANLRGQALSARGDADGAESAFREAGEPHLARIEWAHGLYRAQAYQELLDATESDRASAGPTGSGGWTAERARMELASLSALSAAALGRPGEGIERLESEIERRQERDPSALSAQGPLWLNLGHVHRRAGHWAEAKLCYERSLELATKGKHWQRYAITLGQLAILMREGGEFRRAQDLLEEAWSLRLRAGDEVGAALMRGILALVRLAQGTLAEAIPLAQEAAKDLRTMQRTRDAQWIEGALAVAETRLGRALSVEAPSEEDLPSGRHLLEWAKVAHWNGDARRAEVRWRRALEDARQQGAQEACAQVEALGRRWWRHAEAREPLHPEHWPRLSQAAQQAFAGVLLVEDPALPLAETLAAWERAGHFDRAARLSIAAWARGPEAQRAWARDRALAALERCFQGLSEGEQAHLLRCLLDARDPMPSDLDAWEQANQGGEFLAAPPPAAQRKTPSKASPQPRSGTSNVVPPASPLSEANLNHEDMEVAQILSINERLVEQEDLPTLLGAIVDAALQVTGASRGFLVMEEQGQLSIDLAMDTSRGGIEAGDVEWSRTIVEQCLQAGGALRLADASHHPDFGGARSVENLELRSILCHAFEVDEDVRGVIWVDEPGSVGVFQERTEHLLGLLAGQAALAIRQVRRVQTIQSLASQLRAQVVEQHAELVGARRALAEKNLAPGVAGLVGDSDAMRQVHHWIHKVAPSEISVLVMGESGTGKELVARAMHDWSPRKSSPFVSENCAALPASLVESELFGYRKGAFTGADRDRPGLFERAQGGTLFLDEVGELPMEIQAKLLRVLETRKVRRIGDKAERDVDFRLVVATNRDLAGMVEKETFRADLLFRLDGIRIPLPPLRDRTGDIPLLVEHFLKLEEVKGGPARRVSSAVMQRLASREWPGNVRELANEVKRLCVLSEGDLLDPELVRSNALHSDGQASAGRRLPQGTLEEIEKAAILGAIEACGGDKRQAAKRLGISRAKVYQRLKEWRDADSDPQ